MLCPICRTEMIESYKDFTCQDIECKYGHGAINVVICFKCYGKNESCDLCNGDRVITRQQDREAKQRA